MLVTYLANRTAKSYLSIAKMAHLKADTALFRNNKEFNEFLEPNKATTLRINDHSPKEANDYFFNFFKKKVCNYLDLNAKPPTFDPNRSLVLLHINIRSRNKNLDNFYNFLVKLKFVPDIICLTKLELNYPSIKQLTF